MSEKKLLDSNIKMPLLSLPVRSSVLSLSTGLILLSPGSKLSKEQLVQAGDVTDIVASNLLHCAGIKQAHDVFPKARVWGPISAREIKPDIPWTHLLGRDEWIHEREVRHIPLAGLPTNQESVFVDVAAKTLYVTDLFFNLQKATGWGARIILGLFGTYRRFALSKLFLNGVKDRLAFQSSLKQMMTHDFDRVVMAHGEVLSPARDAVIAAIRERGFSI